GSGVALSADGSTLIVGGPDDATGKGAAWVFTRSGGGWSAQGSKLVAPGGSNGDQFGSSVARSADGNTASVGVPGGNSGTGAAWVFVRNGLTWTSQQKLVGTGTALGNQGTAVSLSGDGNTALIGGPLDGGGLGGAWVFTRSNGTWTQQGQKLGPGGSSGAANF